MLSCTACLCLVERKRVQWLHFSLYHFLFHILQCTQRHTCTQLVDIHIHTQTNSWWTTADCYFSLTNTNFIFHKDKNLEKTPLKVQPQYSNAWRMTPRTIWHLWVQNCGWAKSLNWSAGWIQYELTGMVQNRLKLFIRQQQELLPSALIISDSRLGFLWSPW